MGFARGRRPGCPIGDEPNPELTQMRQEAIQFIPKVVLIQLPGVSPNVQAPSAAKAKFGYAIEAIQQPLFSENGAQQSQPPQARAAA